MQSRTANKEEKEWMAKARDYGCLICHKEGFSMPYEVANDYVALHHVTGKVIPKAHLNTIGLCSKHHQHGDKALHYNLHRFEEKHGSQDSLLCFLQEKLGYDVKGIQR